MAGVIGLDYNAVALVAQWERIEMTTRIFRGLRILELAYLNSSKEDYGRS